MVITGTKSYVQIEDDEGNIARFSGESLLPGDLTRMRRMCPGSGIREKQPMKIGLT